MHAGWYAWIAQVVPPPSWEPAGFAAFALVLLAVLVWAISRFFVIWQKDVQSREEHTAVLGELKDLIRRLYDHMQSRPCLHAPSLHEHF